MNPRATFGVAFLLCSALACNSSTQVASHFAASGQINATQGGLVSVSAASDPTLAGTQISIPANALSANATITIAEGTAVPLPVSTTAKGLAAGPVADFGPSGTSFTAAATVTLPFTLPVGASASTVEVVSVDANDVQSTIPFAKLTFVAGNAANTGTVSFAVTALARFGCVVPPPPATACPPGEFFCGCPGYGGECISDASNIACALNCPIEAVDGGGGVCPDTEGLCCGVCSAALCPADACIGDAGSGCPSGTSYCDCEQQCIPDGEACPLCDPLDGGSSICPPGEEPCCPGDPSTCVPSGAVCALACISQGDAGVPVCPPGDYFCGCPGYAGTCIPDKQACALNCPIEGADAGSPVCPVANQSYCCGVCQTGPCIEQCIVLGDAGVCPAGEDACCGGCQPAGEACPLDCEVDGGSAAGDAGVTATCPSTEYFCGCLDMCISDDDACPDYCTFPGDAGSTATCPSGDFFCGCPGYGGTCEPLGTVCALNCPAEGVDGGTP